MSLFFSVFRFFLSIFFLCSFFFFFFFLKLAFGTPLEDWSSSKLPKLFLRLPQIDFGAKFKNESFQYQKAVSVLDKYLSQRERAMSSSAWKDCESTLRKCWEKKKFDLLAFYARGWYQSRLHLYGRARKDFEELLLYSENFVLEPYLHYELARVYVREKTSKSLEKAKEHLDEALQMSLSRNLKARLNALFADWAIKKKDWKLAYEHLHKIRKRSKYRRDRDFLYKMAYVQLQQKQATRACGWVRKLYVGYPRDWQVRSWGVRLESLKINGQSLSCELGVKAFQKRLKRLCALGMRSLAEKELKEMLENNTKLSEMDQTHLRIAIWDFYDELDKVKKEILSHYEENKDNKNYVLKLGDVHSQLGEYEEAMKLFDKSYQLGGKSSRRWKNKVLWRAFTLSFRFRKYEAAQEKLGKIQARSCERNKVLWYRGWLHYLQDDFSKAYHAFSSLDFRRKPHCFQLNLLQRSKYWAAISLQKQNRPALAKYLLKKLSKSHELSYYSILANIRLKKMDSQSLSFLSYLVGWEPRHPASPKETTWGSYLQNLSDMDEDTKISASTENATLLQRDYFWEQAHQLYWIGDREGAHGALSATGKRIRSRRDRFKLIEGYKKVGAYHSAAYVAEVYFQEERQSNDLNRKNPLWLEAYPRVYGETLKKEAKNYSVSPDFLWAIMRSESFYHRRAISSAGAIGLMQMIPLTGMRIASILNESKDFHPSQFMEPRTSIRYGTYYLHRLKNMFNSNLVLTAASYNAGPHRMKTWLMYFGDLPLDAFVEHIPYLQTRNYVRKVVLNYYIYSLLYGKRKPKAFDMEKVFAFTMPLKIRYVGPYPIKESW